MKPNQDRLVLYICTKAIPEKKTHENSLNGSGNGTVQVSGRGVFCYIPQTNFTPNMTIPVKCQLMDKVCL